MNSGGIGFGDNRTIYGDSMLSTRYGYRALPSIHIIVRDGQVTLAGVVANQADKDLINVRANSVPNVLGWQTIFTSKAGRDNGA
jgi:hyperosmotically inducible protein